MNFITGDVPNTFWGVSTLCPFTLVKRNGMQFNQVLFQLKCCKVIRKKEESYKSGRVDRLVPWNGLLCIY